MTDRVLWEWYFPSVILLPETHHLCLTMRKISDKPRMKYKISDRG